MYSVNDNLRTDRKLIVSDERNTSLFHKSINRTHVLKISFGYYKYSNRQSSNIAIYISIKNISTTEEKPSDGNDINGLNGKDLCEIDGIESESSDSSDEDETHIKSIKGKNELFSCNIQFMLN